MSPRPNAAQSDLLDRFAPDDAEDGDEASAPVPSWLGAVGQMIAALLVVVALVALFIGAAVVVRRLLP